MKKIIFILGLLMVFNALAQRTVGNGGGDAEMKAFLIKANLPNWILFCNLDKNYCQNQTQISSDIITILNLPLTFLPAPKIESSCEKNQVVMSHEQLYVNNKSLSDKDIFKQVFTTYLQCSGNELSLVDQINFDFNPIGQSITKFNLVAFSDLAQDYIFSVDSDTDLHNDLLTETGCSSYSVIAHSKNSFQIQCRNSTDRFLVYPQVTKASKLSLHLFLL